MIKLPKKKFIIPIVFLLVIAAGAAAYFANDQTVPFTEKYTTKFSKSYSDNTYLYTCSREIELKPVGTASSSAEFSAGPSYVPVDPDEAKLYCRTNGVIEYHAVLEVLELPETQAVINKYGNKDVLVQALKAARIKDRPYIQRILPAHKNVDIHCIIVVTTPNEKLYFLEDGATHGYINVPQAEFEDYLAKASKEDRETFWDSLH